MSNALALEEILDAIEEVPEVKPQPLALTKVDTTSKERARSNYKQAEETPFNWPPCAC